MTTQYTPILQLALPVTGELNGTWGDVVNDNITSMVEEAIAGLATISTWTTNAHTLTTADGVTDEARCAMLVLQTGAGGTALSGAGQVICPALTKLYVVKNDAAYAVTVKTSGGSGVAIAAGDTAFVFCDGTNVNACVTQIINGHITGNLTVDGNTTLGDSSADTVTINAGSTTLNDGGAIRFEDNAGGEYVAIKAPATVTATYTLTLPIDDGTNGQALITDGSGNLSWSTAASGDVYGPASATDTAVALFDGTTGKLLKNSTVTVASDGATVIAANSTSDGLRITQIGTGNALLVEDSANPDSTPFVVDSIGRVLAGTPTALNVSGEAGFEQLQITSTTSLSRWNAASSGPNFTFAKSRSATIGTNTIVQDSDSLGSLVFNGADGTSFISGARIQALVDGTPGTNDMPGRLVFSTTADGASSPTERMRIDSAGRVGIGGAASQYAKVEINGALPSYFTFSYGLYSAGTVPASTTGGYINFYSYPTTVAAAFTVSTLTHFYANQGTIGAGSSVGTQYGFRVDGSLTGATNNYGFHSNIAAGTGRYNFYAAGSADNYFAGPTTISVSTTSDALRITQVGTGNALLVEDSANPDSSPFVVNSNGDVISGHTSVLTTVSGLGGGIQSVLGINQIAFSGFRFQDDTTGPQFVANKARGSVSSPTIVANGDNIGQFWWAGYDGAAYLRAASIIGSVDGTPGTNDMPGRLVFSTTADGASSPTERMRIDNAGRVGIGTTSITNYNLKVFKPLTGSTTAFSISTEGIVQSDVTSNAIYYSTEAVTAAASFTISNLHHYRATQGTIGAGSAVTNQYGFRVESTLTGATNNYGFYSNIASGTGRYNFYAAGTADNFFAGKVGIGFAPVAGLIFRVSGSQAGDGASSLTANYVDIQFNDAAVTAGTGFATFINPQTGTALSTLKHFNAAQRAFTGTATNQYGFFADTTLTGATNNYGFYSNIASGTGRYNFYAAGTADNFFAGSVGIGSTVLTNYGLRISKQMTGSTAARGVQIDSQIQSDVTSTAIAFATSIGTAAASFTLGDFYHFSAGQSAIGAGSAITTQMGFLANSNLIGATNNYGFYSNIASGTGRWNFYASGTAANYMAGTLQTGSTIGVGAATPATTGAGITFPATQSASSDANTLDDYEEGTWTPRIYKNGTEITSPTQTYGYYVKIGQTVFVSFYWYKSSGTSASGGAYTVNFPITGANYNYSFIPGGYCEINGSQISGVPRWQVSANTTTAGLYNGSGQPTTDWTSSFLEFSATGTYQASA